MPREALYPFSREGEAVSSGSRHGDNVAPMLLGGVVMATDSRMIPLAAPDWLHCAVVHPDQVLETRRARTVLADPYPLHALVEQSTHLALFLTGLQRRSEEQTSELQSLMRISYAVFCLKKKNTIKNNLHDDINQLQQH